MPVASARVVKEKKKGGRFGFGVGTSVYGVTWLMKVPQLAMRLRGRFGMYSVPIHMLPAESAEAAE